MTVRGTTSASFELFPKSLKPIGLWRLLSERAWRVIRLAEQVRARHRCGICGRLSRWPRRPGKKGRRLICHEHWRFDDRRRVLTLQEFQILCQDCHNLYHPYYPGMLFKGMVVYRQGGRLLEAKEIGRLRRARRLPRVREKQYLRTVDDQKGRLTGPWRLQIAPALQVRYPILRNTLLFGIIKERARAAHRRAEMQQATP